MTIRPTLAQLLACVLPCPGFALRNRNRAPATLALLILTGAAGGAPPVVTAVSDNSVPCSGRFVITGSSLGSAPSARVEIGGTSVPTTRWGGSSITAYVRGDIAPGPTTLRVVTAEGTSNSLAFTVEPLPPAEGRVAWRFQADSPYFLHRAAVGADGTVYAQDVRGFLYAISAEGRLRWIYNAGGYPSGGGGEGPVAIIADGTIVVVGNPLGLDVNVIGVNPDGSHAWTFTDTNTQGVIAGPNVGPDGRIYVVTDYGGRGVIAINANGSLAWSDTGSPAISENGQTGEEIVFGPASPGGPVSQLYCAFDMRGTGVSDSVFAFSLSGNFRFATLTGAQGDPLAQRQGQPAVGPDGSVYITAGGRLQKFNPGSGDPVWGYFSPSGLSEPDAGHDGTIFVTRNGGELNAVNPNASQRWTFSDGTMLFAPIAGPAGGPVVVGGRITYGEPGFVKAFGYADGSLLWTVPLPSEGGLSQIPYTRAKFAADGRRVYMGTTIPGQPSGQEYCYLLALDIVPPCLGDADSDHLVNFADITHVLANFNANYTSGTGLGDADHNGLVNFSDITSVLANWLATCP